MTEQDRFHLGDLLTVTTGRMFAPDSFDGVYQVLRHLCGEPVSTHQIPLALDAMKPQVLDQHGWLTGLEPPPEVSGADALTGWLARMAAEHGEFHNLRPAPEAWGSHDPVEDFVALGGDPSSVIPVELPADRS